MKIREKGVVRDYNEAKTVRDTVECHVVDSVYLNSLVLSRTVLAGGQSTRGHKHDNAEEIYVFIEGSGIMLTDENKTHVVSAGDTVELRSGEFHRVINSSKNEPLSFLCVFQAYENRN